MKAALFLLTFLLSSTCFAQQTPAPAPQKSTLKTQTAAELAAQVPAAKSGDVKSMDAILSAIYDVISGPAGDRDWNRFRSLFVPQARFSQVVKAADGTVTVSLFNVDEFIAAARDVFAKEPFYEKALVNRPQVFGQVAQVFSSYESRHSLKEKPFQRGINSIQLFNDGKRWWVLSILWDSERPGNPLPAQFASATDKKK